MVLVSPPGPGGDFILFSRGADAGDRAAEGVCDLLRSAAGGAGDGRGRRGVAGRATRGWIPPDVLAIPGERLRTVGAGAMAGDVLRRRAAQIRRPAVADRTDFLPVVRG